MTDDSAAHDIDTLAFYDREASKYAARPKRERNARLEHFLAGLVPGSKILELGCGGGHDAERMIRAGFDVTPTDGSPGLAREAEQRLGRPVQVLRFEDLDWQATHDAVWANACLLHVPADQFAGVLARIHAALCPGGRFYASFKLGEGGGRDRLGRYYNFPSRETLLASYSRAARWTSVTIEDAPGIGYDGVRCTFMHVTAMKA